MCSVTQSYLTLLSPMDCRLPGSSAHGIFQTRILVWVAISFSRGSCWPRDLTWVSWVSCINKWVLYNRATWEAHFLPLPLSFYSLVLIVFCVKCLFIYSLFFGNAFKAKNCSVHCFAAPSRSYVLLHCHPLRACCDFHCDVLFTALII